jgi:hypothetical protein
LTINQRSFTLFPLAKKLPKHNNEKDFFELLFAAILINLTTRLEEVFMRFLLTTFWFVTSVLLLAFLVLADADDAADFLVNVTPAQLSGADAVIPVGVSSNFNVSVTVKNTPTTSGEIKPGAAQWHFNGVTGIGNSAIGADEVNKWTESGTRTIAISTDTSGQYTLTFSMSVRFPKLNNNDVHIRDANNNLLYYDAVTKTKNLTLWVVGIDSIKYKRSSDTTWQTPSGTIYVPKGQTIQFEAIKTPTNAPCFPDNYLCQQFNFIVCNKR